MTGLLEGRVCLVTGASRGIGRAIALALAAEGATLAICGRDLEALEQTLRLLGDGHAAEVADVGVEADVERLVARAERLGPLEVVVNNAAVAGPTAPVAELAVGDFQAVLQANLVGPFLVSKHALVGMLARGRGSIVNIGSVAGVEGYPLRSPYSASKWGLVGLTRTLAGEVGPAGVRVNLVAPGPTEGERSAGVMAARAAALGVKPGEVQASYAAQIPLRRFVTAQECAAAVVFLASDASSGMTGQSFCVSGGYEI